MGLGPTPTQALILRSLSGKGSAPHSTEELLLLKFLDLLKVTSWVEMYYKKLGLSHCPGG